MQSLHFKPNFWMMSTILDGELFWIVWLWEECRHYYKLCSQSKCMTHIWHMNKSWSHGVSDKLIYSYNLVLLLCRISFDRIHLKEVCNSSSECRSFSFYCTLTNGKLIKVYSEITDVKRSFAKMIKAFQIVFHIFYFLASAPSFIQCKIYILKVFNVCSEFCSHCCIWDQLLVWGSKLICNSIKFNWFIKPPKLNSILGQTKFNIFFSRWAPTNQHQ